MSQWWLARDETVYGPYELTQLREMLLQRELTDTDQFSVVGMETWVTLEVFAREQCDSPALPELSPSAPAGSPAHADAKTKKAKPPRRQEKASAAQKEYMRSLGVPIVPGMTMAEARTAITAAIEGGAKERLESSRRKENRLNGAMLSVNGGGSHDRGYGHPLKYVKKEQLLQVMDWLDVQYPNWDANAWGFDVSPFKVLDEWLAPAIAGLHPDLIKDSYWDDFGPGRKWQVLA